MSDRSCLRLCCKILLNSLCMLSVHRLVLYQQDSPVNICKYDNKITGNNYRNTCNGSIIYYKYV